MIDLVPNSRYRFEQTPLKPDAAEMRNGEHRFAGSLYNSGVTDEGQGTTLLQSGPTRSAVRGAGEGVPDVSAADSRQTAASANRLAPNHSSEF
jgi:hypothetical protein